LLYLWWPCCCEHEGLAVRSDSVIADLLDAVFKAHIEEAVCLVNDEVCDSSEGYVVRVEKVKKSAGSCAEDVDSFADFRDLVGSVDASNDLTDTYFGLLGVGLADPRKLLDKFSCWSNYKNNRAFSRARNFLVQQMNNGREQISQCLS